MFSKCIRHRLGRCLFVGQVMFSHHSDQMSQRSKVSWSWILLHCNQRHLTSEFIYLGEYFRFQRILFKSLKDCSLKVFSKCHCLCLCLCICLCICLCRCVFVGQVMFLHDPHQFCKVLIWSGRLEGFESNTRTKQWRLTSDQGRPRAARAAKNGRIATCGNFSSLRFLNISKVSWSWDTSLE